MTTMIKVQQRPVARRLQATAAAAGLLVLSLLAVGSVPAQAQNPLPGPTPAPADVNCDGRVNIQDAYVVAGFAVGAVADGGPCPVDRFEINAAVADVDLDGRVSILDAKIIAFCSVGIEPQRCAIDRIAVNDRFENATVVVPSAGGTLIAEDFNLLPTLEPDEPVATQSCVPEYAREGSVWYRFTATTGRVMIEDSTDDQYFGLYRAADDAGDPPTLGDLEVISCAQSQFFGGAIVQPGEEYWLSNSGDWFNKFWLFAGDPVCLSAEMTCGDGFNDTLSVSPTPIDLRGSAPTVVPETSIAATFGPGEPDADRCINGTVGSLWYRFEAPTTGAAITGTANQIVAVFERAELRSGQWWRPPGTLDSLRLVGCQPNAAEGLTVVTNPDETYVIGVSGSEPGDEFTIQAFSEVP